MIGGFSGTVRGVADLARLRHEMRAWLERAGCRESATGDLLLAVHELATNAVEAAPDSTAQVRATAEAPHVRVVVMNEGPRFQGLPAGPRREILSERGRGIDLVEAVTDSLQFEHLHGCTEAT